MVMVCPQQQTPLRVAWPLAHVRAGLSGGGVLAALVKNAQAIASTIKTLFCQGFFSCSPFNCTSAQHL